MIDDLHTRWFKLGKKYFKDANHMEIVWDRIKRNYSGRKRYYHNLHHIHQMLKQADENEQSLHEKDVVLFSIWFHDIIYKSTKKNNEEKSAEFARSVLEKTSMNEKSINKIYDLIISTKKHEIINSEDIDNAFLLDFDLSVLGQKWDVYKKYTESIRKEYSIYPEILYKPGRKKVLITFLKRETLFFTKKYQELYEQQARKNLEREIKTLV